MKLTLKWRKKHLIGIDSYGSEHWSAVYKGYYIRAIGGYFIVEYDRTVLRMYDKTLNLEDCIKRIDSLSWSFWK